MKFAPTPKSGILDIDLYVGGKGHLDGVENVVKLSSNENPHGPSPRAIDAFKAEAKFLNYYPSSDHAELRETLAEVHGLDAERIICSNGSDELISFLTQAFAGEGDEVIFTEYGFLMYKVCTLSAGATPVVVAEKDRHTDVDAILAAVTENTKLVFIANPNNPTSTFIELSEIERLVAGLPEHIVLVLDGAYAEFVDGYDGGASLSDTYPNIVMTRTFSKVYGMGGARLGWGYSSKPMIEILSRVRGPFNVNSGALAAGVAAAKDIEYFELCIKRNAKARDRLAKGLADIGLQSEPSFTNFVLVDFGSETDADAADKLLQHNGILIRAVKGYGLPSCLRITVGKMVDCDRIVSILTEFQKGRAT